MSSNVYGVINLAAFESNIRWTDQGLCLVYSYYFLGVKSTHLLGLFTDFPVCRVDFFGVYSVNDFHSILLLAYLTILLIELFNDQFIVFLVLLNLCSNFFWSFLSEWNVS